WANSAPTRPRLSQTPRRIVSISAGDFSGNAAVRLARPIRCSGSHGPTPRITRPARFAMVPTSTSRMTRSSCTVRKPNTASPVRRSHDPRLRLPPAIGGLELDHDLAEHLAAFQPRDAAFKIGEAEFGVDDGEEAVRHLGETVADVADRGAERAED